jgi:predicted P-loop ATPase
MDVKTQVTRVPSTLANLGYNFRMNELNDRVEVNGVPISDVIESEMMNKLRQRGFTSEKACRDAWISEAARNRFHPVKEYFNQLSYDGSKAISALSNFFVDDDGTFEPWLRRWLIGAVRRGIAWRGDQNRVWVLLGKQGLGKSQFADWLCPPQLKKYFQARPIFPSKTDDRLALAFTWIWEVAELGATTERSHRELLKHYLSMTGVTERGPYGKHPLVKPALTSFIATSNKDELFYDPTGYRRYMTTKINSIDWSYAEAVNIDQVWAEASMLYVAGESADLTTNEAQLAESNCKGYEMENVVEGMIVKHYNIDPTNTSAWTASADIVAMLTNIGGWKGSTKKLTMEISDAMHNFGVRKIPRRPPGKTSTCQGYEGVW